MSDIVHKFKKITYGLFICKDPYSNKTLKIDKDGIIACTEGFFSPRQRKQFICISDKQVDNKTDTGVMLSVVPDPINIGKYNIINPITGKSINEIPLEKEKAEEISGVKAEENNIEGIVDVEDEENKEDEEKDNEKKTMKKRKIIKKSK